MSSTVHLPLADRRRATRPERRARRRRAMVALGFRRALRDARRPPRGLSALAAVERSQVLDAAPDIELPIARLSDLGRPVDDAGIRLAGSLLRDGTGPLFAPAEPGALRHRVRLISEAMG